MTKKEDHPFVCDLTAIPVVEREKHLAAVGGIDCCDHLSFCGGLHPVPAAGNLRLNEMAKEGNTACLFPSFAMIVRRGLSLLASSRITCRSPALMFRIASLRQASIRSGFVICH